MTTRLLSATAALSLCFMGCVPADDGPGETSRGGIGKADTVGSCVDSDCDGPAPDGNCYCDDQCAEYGDCCDDYKPACDYIACGGFAGLLCPDNMSCVDYPLDECDPENGGADCIGMCEPVIALCGGFMGLTCGEGEFCYYELDEMCGAADQLGECKVKPEVCIELYAPVCGCNGETYGNECFANSAGTSAASQGECTPLTCEQYSGFCTSGDICPADTVEIEEATCSGGGTCCKAWQPPPPPQVECIEAGGFCVESPECPADTISGEESCGSLGGQCCKPWYPQPIPSCEGQCGGPVVGGACYCDEGCADYGDCCDDFDEYCAGREIASGMCVKNSLETCDTDDDCVAGGCGGELCYNPANGGGISTCECTTPTGPSGCGCVAGQCAWYN